MVDTNANSLNQITAALQNYVVAPVNAFGMAGFLFDYASESVANLRADITDHYTEDNRALQDHMAIHPRRITLRGYVGELIYYGAQGNNSTLQTLTKKLTEVTAYLPKLSSAAIQLKESIDNPENSDVTLNDASNIYGVVKNALTGLGIGANQQNAYAYFKALQSQAILMGIQTPWEFIPSMAIENVVAVQPEWTQFITDFSVTFKEIRIAQTIQSAYSPNSTSLQGAASVQSTLENPRGQVPGLLMDGSYIPNVSPPGAQATMNGAQSIYSNPYLRGIFDDKFKNFLGG